MKLLRMRMMKPYICLMGGNGVFCEQVLQGGVGVGGGGRRCRVNVDPPSTPPASSSTGSAAGSSKHIKLIKPDGVVTIFQKPVKASELMEEYPKHMVCRSDSFYIGQKIPHLSQQDKLQRGNTYFLLPSHIFHSVLSFVTIASFASPQRPPRPQSSSPSQLLKSPVAAVTANSTTSTSVVFGSSSSSKREEHEEQMKSRAALLKKAAGSSRSSSSPPAFDIQKTKSGTLRIRVSEVFISQLIMDQQDQDKKQLIDQEEDDEMKKRVLCTTPQLHKDYKQLVMGSRVRHWKPKLDMISEAAAIPKEKRKTLLSSASFGIKSKKSQLPHQQHDHDQPKTRPVTAAPKVLQQHAMISEAAAIPKEKRKALLSSASFGIKRKKKSSSKSTKKSQLPQHQHDHDQIKTRHAAAHDHAAPPLLQQNDIINPPPQSQSLSTTKSPSTCKLRRFKLKLRGLTASTTSPSRSTCKSRKHLQHSSA